MQNKTNRKKAARRLIFVKGQPVYYCGLFCRFFFCFELFFLFVSVVVIYARLASDNVHWNIWTGRILLHLASLAQPLENDIFQFSS